MYLHCDIGRSAIKALLSPSYAKLSSVPKVTSESEASQLLAKILPYDFFLRIIRGASTTPSGPGAGASIKTISVDPQQHFASDEFYVWVYDADQTKMLLLAFGMVLIVLAAVMFPLWPVKLRIGVWYLSMAVLGLLGLFFGIAILRLILWLITIVVAKPGIWIFPELFADVGFVRRIQTLSYFMVFLLFLCSVLTFFNIVSSNHLFRCGIGIFLSRRDRNPNRWRAAARNRGRIDCRNRVLLLL